MYYALIVNPVAGNGYALKVLEKMEAVLREKGLSYRVFRTRQPRHAVDLAFSLRDHRDIQAVISIGGDGTAFETASGLAGSRVPLGIIPAGTGNDFIKSAGIPGNPEKALEMILRGNSSPVDMGSLNSGSFLNVCGTGFDVTVLDYAENLKTRYRGLLPYFLGLLKAIAHYQPVHLKLVIDGQEEEGDYLICSIANGRYIGGGIPICPAAEITDGKLDLVLVKNVPRRRIPLYLPGLMMGRILRFQITRHVLADEVMMEGRNLRVNVDGEIIPMDRIHFSIRKGVLQLIHPGITQEAGGIPSGKAD